MDGVWRTFISRLKDCRKAAILIIVPVIVLPIIDLGDARVAPSFALDEPASDTGSGVAKLSAEKRKVVSHCDYSDKIWASMAASAKSVPDTESKDVRGKILKTYSADVEHINSIFGTKGELDLVDIGICSFFNKRNSAYYLVAGVKSLLIFLFLTGLAQLADRLLLNGKFDEIFKELQKGKEDIDKDREKQQAEEKRRGGGATPQPPTAPAAATWADHFSSHKGLLGLTGAFAVTLYLSINIAISLPAITYNAAPVTVNIPQVQYALPSPTGLAQPPEKPTSDDPECGKKCQKTVSDIVETQIAKKPIVYQSELDKVDERVKAIGVQFELLTQALLQDLRVQIQKLNLQVNGPR